MGRRAVMGRGSPPCSGYRASVPSRANPTTESSPNVPVIAHVPSGVTGTRFPPSTSRRNVRKSRSGSAATSSTCVASRNQPSPTCCSPAVDSGRVGPAPVGVTTISCAGGVPRSTSAHFASGEIPRGAPSESRTGAAVGGPQERPSAWRLGEVVEEQLTPVGRDLYTVVGVDDRDVVLAPLAGTLGPGADALEAVMDEQPPIGRDVVQHRGAGQAGGFARAPVEAHAPKAGGSSRVVGAAYPYRVAGRIPGETPELLLAAGPPKSPELPAPLDDADSVSGRIGDLVPSGRDAELEPAIDVSQHRSHEDVARRELELIRARDPTQDGEILAVGGPVGGIDALGHLPRSPAQEGDAGEGAGPDEPSLARPTEDDGQLPAAGDAAEASGGQRQQ